MTDKRQILKRVKKVNTPEIKAKTSLKEILVPLIGCLLVEALIIILARWS